MIKISTVKYGKYIDFFAEKMGVAFALQKLLTFLQQKYQCIWKYLKATTVNKFVINQFNKQCFEQLGPGFTEPDYERYCNMQCYSSPLVLAWPIYLEWTLLPQLFGPSISNSRVSD